MLDMLYLFGFVKTFVLADRCHVCERFLYCTLLSERHVVSFISTFSDVHSVDVLYFLITASARWFCTVLHWITCADVVALMMTTLSSLHRAWGVTGAIRAWIKSVIKRASH